MISISIASRPNPWRIHGGIPIETPASPSLSGIRKYHVNSGVPTCQLRSAENCRSFFSLPDGKQSFRKKVKKILNHSKSELNIALASHGSLSICSTAINWFILINDVEVSREC
ncbi:Protein of unknown function [Pyronema omphalodes CBS 100304]|uniref:Uncharacterized protein n=1 Tax=Pyronema omphalodes (strain CBS 100304) TaxID=1076935 RepID=U4L4W8_PYROM|nr:Protein of unknown function [Pyronema omphalodes CBS 100304]